MEFGKREKNSKLIYGGVLLILLGALLIFFGYREVNSDESGTEILKQTVYIGDGPMVDENEGKTVIIMGKMKEDKMVSDPAVGVSIDSVCAYRKVEHREWVEDTDDNDEQSTGKFVWKTVDRGDSQNEVSSDYLYGVASINGTVLDDSILRSLPRENNYDGFKDSELNDSTWKYIKNPEGQAFLSMAPVEYTMNGDEAMDQGDVNENPDEGRLRVSYDYLDLTKVSEDGYFTVIGIQSGNKIVKNPQLKESIFAGKVSFTEVADREMSAAGGKGKYLFYMASVIFVAGVYMIYKGRGYY